MGLVSVELSNRMISPDTASIIACLSDPGPLSFELVTVIVAENNVTPLKSKNAKEIIRFLCFIIVDLVYK